jgi:cell division protein FtsW
MDKNSEKLNAFRYGPLPSAIITIGFCGLVLLQSNFSEALFIVLVSAIICLMGGIRLRWFVLGGGLFIPAVYLLISSDKDGRWYQRFISFFSKEPDPTGSDYQIKMSIEAVQSGGFWGKGIGQGMLKTRMPEVHGDFVFASYAEESGFLGVLFYLALIGVFAWIGYLSAWKNRNRFFMIFSFGLVTSIVIQTLLNIAVVVRLMPTTGIPLPFVSSGGSSLIVTLTAAALLVNMTRWNISSGNMEENNVR